MLFLSFLATRSFGLQRIKPKDKPNDEVTTEDKNSIVYEVHCSIYEAVYFGEPKWSLKLRSDE